MFFFNSAESNSITKLAAFYDRIGEIGTLKIGIMIEEVEEVEEVADIEEWTEWSEVGSA